MTLIELVVFKQNHAFFKYSRKECPEYKIVLSLYTPDCKWAAKPVGWEHTD